MSEHFISHNNPDKLNLVAELCLCIPAVGLQRDGPSEKQHADESGAAVHKQMESAGSIEHTWHREKERERERDTEGGEDRRRLHATCISTAQRSEAGDVAPYFKTEPGPPEIHLEGNRLVMTCLAEGSWPLEFKWILNNTDITAFSPEYKFIVPSLQRSDMGVYQCVVRNRMGALLQKRAEIQVAYMGDFVEADQRKTVTQGRAAIVNAPDVSSFPRPQVTWFRDGYKIIPSSRVSLPRHRQARLILFPIIAQVSSSFWLAVAEPQITALYTSQPYLMTHPTKIKMALFKNTVLFHQRA
ncbi:protein sidekick-1 isoform X2 [Clarias magur]|uniref:Protein sidekick-1 isoform X2 n=1 Tax=Clarias magur TaxID=1594786 RepID=A0A8J4U3Z8_CLAMG|nr:protein sidekick-1 isoform X2 [Clarias magur]